MKARHVLYGFVAVVAVVGCGRDSLQLGKRERCAKPAAPRDAVPLGLSLQPTCEAPARSSTIGTLVQLVLGRIDEERTKAFEAKGLRLERAGDRAEIIEALLTEEPLLVEHADAWTRSWLGIPKTSPFPNRFDADLWEALREQTLLQGRSVFIDEEPLQSLLLGETTFVNADLARFYGFSPVPTGGGFMRVKAARPRTGVLAHAAVLGSHPSVTGRGAFLFNKMIACQMVPTGPSGVRGHDRTPTTLASKKDLDDARAGACAGCHAQLDVGFALHQFDERGLIRTRQADGSPIDAKTEVIDVDGTRRTVDGLPELAQALDEAGTWRTCLAAAVLDAAAARTGLAFAEEADAPCSPASLLGEKWRRQSQIDVKQVLVDVASLIAGGRFSESLSPLPPAPERDPEPDDGDDDDSCAPMGDEGR